REDDQKRMTELAHEKESLVNAEKGERRNPTSTEPPQAPPAVAGTNGTPASAGSNGAQAAARQAPETTPTGTAGQTSAIRTPTKGVLAVTNARIYPVSRPAIEQGTIVMRDGIIEAVGANVTVPSGAQVIDAAGADVYPGLINAQTT